MARNAAFLLLAPLLSACPAVRNEPPRLARPAATHTVEIHTYSETQPFTSLAVLKESLYAGTPAGVVRFDLESRQCIRLSREQGLPGNQVQALSGHAGSGLWVATDGGISRFHGGAWTNGPPAPGVGAATALLATSDGLWVGGPQGLARLRGGAWKQFLPGASVTVLRSDLGGNSVWVGTEGEGIFRAQGETITSFSPARGQPLRRVQSVAFTREGGVVAVGRDDRHQHRLAFFDGRHWTAYSLQPPGRLSWVERLGDELLMAYNDRILALDRLGASARGVPASKRPGPVVLVPDRSPQAPPGWPVPAFVTREVERWLTGEVTVVVGDGRQLFLGTRTAGAAVYDGRRLSWFRTRDLTGGSDRLRVGCAADGACYLATGGKALQLEPRGFRPAVVDEDPTLRVQTFCESPSALLAASVAADGQTVVVSRLEGQRFTRLYESKVAIPEGRAEVRFARLAPDAKLWVGLSYIDRDGIGHPWGVAILASEEPPRYHRSTLLPAEDRQPGSLALPDDIRDVLFAGDDTWFSTSSGICRVRGSRIDVFTENEGLESEIVYSLAHGPGGQLFAASHGGVGRFDGKWWHFDLGGVLRKPSRALVPRGQYLWAGTTAGLVGWSPGGLRLIDSRLGLAGDRVLDLYLEADRRLWVLTDEGLSIVSL